MKQKTKIFESNKLIDAIEQCLAEGYFPASMPEIMKLKYDGVIDKNKYWDTSTLEYKGEFKKATLEQLKNIRAIYANDGRLWCVRRCYDYSNVYGINYLDYSSGCLFGVASETPKRRKK